jgi:hypothetical protein
MLGYTLQPWQQAAGDVVLEVDPVTGLLVYREVDLTVPRQSGKTLLLLCVMTLRCLFRSRQRVLYTAQTRNDARKKWEDEHVALLQASPLRSRFRVRLSNGAEAIRWANGSMHGITSSTEKAGHGDTLDLGVIDEAFAHEDSRLEQGLSPTMITRPDPQLWVVSTAGTKKSLYLRGKVDAGRAREQAGVRSSVAYFEWSAPDDADPADPATWYGCMPALGHTVTERAIRQELERMELREFRRAYLNQWQGDVPEEWLVIPKGVWTALADPASQIVGRMAFAADVTPDRSAGAIGVAGARSDAMVHAEVVEHRPGVGWMHERILRLNERWHPCAWVIDAAGPAGTLMAPLEAAGVEVVAPSLREAAHAAQSFYDATGANPKVDDPAWLRHLDQPALAAALAGAQKRELGDVWLWARKGLSVDISPLVAVTLAAWGFATRGHVAEVTSEPLVAWR